MDRGIAGPGAQKPILSRLIWRACPARHNFYRKSVTNRVLGSLIGESEVKERLILKSCIRATSGTSTDTRARCQKMSPSPRKSRRRPSSRRWTASTRSTVNAGSTSGCARSQKTPISTILKRRSAAGTARTPENFRRTAVCAGGRAHHGNRTFQRLLRGGSCGQPQRRRPSLSVSGKIPENGKKKLRIFPGGAAPPGCQTSFLSSPEAAAAARSARRLAFS